MKLDFNWTKDDQYHQYCINCLNESVKRVFKNGRSFYYCSNCKQTLERSIAIDPGIIWWEAKDGEYWHESGGVFIRNLQGKFLFFERLLYPFALTVPAGHVDTGEKPLEATRRETFEEVGLSAEDQDFHLIGTEDIVGDSCSRGADAHRWHAYLLQLKDNVDLQVTEADEGEKPVWLTLDQALTKDIVFPVEFIINKYHRQLIS